MFRGCSRTLKTPNSPPLDRGVAPQLQRGPERKDIGDIATGEVKTVCTY